LNKLYGKEVESLWENYDLLKGAMPWIIAQENFTVGSLLTAAVLYQISKWVLLPLRPEIAKGS
jgi:hypothetical protein